MSDAEIEPGKESSRLFLSTMTSKGQVTIPAELRKLLGLKPGDKVGFLVQGDQVRLVRVGSVVERTAGLFKWEGPALTAEELRKEAEIAIAEDVMKRSSR